MFRANKPKTCYEKRKLVLKVGMAKPTRQVVTENLVFAMREAELNNTQLAERIGVTSMTVGRYVSGKAEISYEMFDKISKVTGKTPDWFLKDRSGLNPPKHDLTIDELTEALTRMVTKLKALKKG